LFQIHGSFLTFTFDKVVYRRLYGVTGPLIDQFNIADCRVRVWKKIENRSTFAEVVM